MFFGVNQSKVDGIIMHKFKLKLVALLALPILASGTAFAVESDGNKLEKRAIDRMLMLEKYIKIQEEIQSIGTGEISVPPNPPR